MTNELATLSAAEKAIEVASTPEESQAVERIAAAGIAFFRKQEEEGLGNLLKAWEVFFRARRKTTELIAPTVRQGQHGREGDTYVTFLADYGLDKKQWSRRTREAGIEWQTVLNYLDGCGANEIDPSIAGLLKFSSGAGFYQSSESVEWSTPQWLFDLLDTEFKFKTDVCASLDNAKCKVYFDEKMNGLEQDWGGACWMNPPYGNEISKWMEKARQSAMDGATVVCLVPGAYETRWFRESAQMGEVRLLNNGRVRWQEMSAAPFPSAVIILAPKKRASVKFWSLEQPNGV